MKSKSFIIIILLSLGLFTGLLFGVYKFSSKSNKEFYYDGYVSITDTDISDKAFFASGTSYKNGYNNEIIFKNTEDEKKEVSKYSFVYYKNKSIGYLSDGVLMELDGLDAELVPYYNIKSNYLIEYLDNHYVIKTTSKNIELNNFIGRISEGKYIVAGNDLKLKLSSSEEMLSNYYFEINFGEGNQVKIDNDKTNVKTISDDTYILVGNDVKIDLSKKIITYKDELKANLSEIVINSDNNIDILYDNTKDKNSGEGGGNGNGQGGNGTGLDPEKEEYEPEKTVEYKNVPYVEIVDSSTSAHKISLTFRTIDNNDLIRGNVKVKLLNLSTKKVYEQAFENYKELIKYEMDGLSSNTAYLLTIQTSYIRNGVVHNDYTMFQRTYNTNSFETEVLKDYSSSDTLSYRIKMDSSVGFDGGQLNLYDSNGNLVSSKSFEANGQDVYVTFNELASNTGYIAKLENLVAGSIIYSTTSATSSSKTLKYNPFKDASVVNQPSAIVNKKDSKFTLDLGTNFNDRDKAISEVKYNIYEAETGKLVKTITKPDTNEFTISLDEDITAKKTYKFEAIATISDNEKTVYQKSLMSNEFSIYNKISPTVSFTKGEVTANNLSGKFVIYDEDNAVDVDQRIYAEYTSSQGDTKEKTLSFSPCPATESETSKCADLSLSELQSDEVYTIRLYAYVDLMDEEFEPGTIQIGATKINTEVADIVIASMITKEFSDVTEALEKVFEVEMHFSLDTDTSEDVKENMSSFDILLYEGADSTGRFLGTKHVTKDIIENYFDSSTNLTIADFDLSLSDLRAIHLADNTDLSSKYTIKLTNGKSGSDYVDFRPPTLTFEIDETLLELANTDADLVIDEIKNNKTLEIYDANLLETTTIGLKLQPTFKNINKYVIGINYLIYDVTDANETIPYPNENSGIKLDLSLEDDDEIPAYELIFANDETNFVRRGRKYKIEYTLLLDLDHDGKMDREFPFNAEDITKVEPVRSSLTPVITLVKQQPSAQLIPWTSDVTSITYKYAITDVDNSLMDDDNIYFTLNGTGVPAQKVDCKISSNALKTSIGACIKLGSFSENSIYTISLNPTLVELSENTTYVAIGDFEFDKQLEINAMKDLINVSKMVKYNNIFLFRIFDDNGSNYIKKIASYDVILSSGNHEFTISNINNGPRDSKYNKNQNTITYKNLSTKVTKSETGDGFGYVDACDENNLNCIFIDYAKLYNSSILGSYFKELKNQNINVTIKVTYDSGKVGYYASSNNKYAFKISSREAIIYDHEEFNNYYIIRDPKGFNLSENAISGMYSYSMSNKGNTRYGFVDDEAYDYGYSGLKGKISFVNSIYDTPSEEELDYEVTSRGVEVSINGLKAPIVAKELSTATLTQRATVNYETVSPAIGFKYTPTSTVNGLKMDLVPSGYSETDVDSENGKKYIYIETYKKTSNEDEPLTGALVQTIKVVSGEISSQSGKVNNNKYTLRKTVEGSYGNYLFNVSSIKVSGYSNVTYNYDYLTGEITFNKDIADGTEIVVYYSLILYGLDINTDYYMMVYVNMNNNKVYLTDMQSSTYEELKYGFKTLLPGDTIVYDLSLDSISNDDYEHRYIKTSFALEDIIGFEGFTYSICPKSGGKCVNTTKYDSCAKSFNVMGDTCINTSDKSYALYNLDAYHDISITSDEDFIFNTDYVVYVSGKVRGLSTITSYEMYSDTIKIRPLVDANIDVEQYSHYNSTDGYSVRFEVNFTDNDKVVSAYDTLNGIPTSNSGKYITYLTKGASRTKIVGTEREVDIATKNPEVFNYTNLDKNTEYNLIVTYKTYLNNFGINKQLNSYSKNYLIYTLNDNRVSVGKLFYTAGDNKTILRFGYASNIGVNYVKDGNGNTVPDPLQEAYVGGIMYTIRRISGDDTFVIDGTKFFDSVCTGESTNCIEYKTNTGNTEIGDSYYQITLDNTAYTEKDAYYNILFKFYLGGNIASSYTTENACTKTDGISNGNIWRDGKCFVLGDIEYTQDTQYVGGAA